MSDGFAPRSCWNTDSRVRYLREHFGFEPFWPAHLIGKPKN